MARFECDLCSRRAKCVGPISPDVRGTDLLIIGESPGPEEEKYGIPFYHDAPCGRLLRTSLAACNMSASFTITNSACCFSNGKPTDKQVEACRIHWTELAKQHPYKAILALGAYAAKSVLNRPVRITEEVGQVVPVEIGSVTIPVILSFHPSYILRMKQEHGGASEKAEQAWLNTWQTVDRVLHGGEIEQPPPTACVIDAAKIETGLTGLIKYREQNPTTPMTYDYETWGDKTALRPELCSMFQILTVAVGFHWKGFIEAVSFPLDDRRADVWRNKQVFSLWKQFISTPGVWVAQNSKYEHKCNLRRWGRTWPLEDTMLRMNLLDERAAANLASIAHRMGIGWSYYKTSMHGIQIDPSSVELGALLRYNGLDALCTLISYEKLTELLTAEEMIPPALLAEQYAYHLAYVEMNGMYSDADEVAKVRDEIRIQLETATESFRKHKAVQEAELWNFENIKSCKKNPTFNPSSPTQMQHLCLDILRLKVEPDRDGKTPLNKLVLDKHADKHPVIRDLLQVRSLASMKTGFLDKWDDFTGPDECVHTNYVQEEVLTGRLASRDPNLQNIPKHSPVRRVFSSRFPGGIIVNGDFNQLEPRILAGWSGDKNLCYALQNGFDLHLYVTAAINNLEYEELFILYRGGDAKAAKLRDLGKRMNLGNMYGQTEYGLAQKANITQDEAIRLLQLYNERFPGVEQLRDEFKRHALRHGWVADLFGRRRHLDKVRSANTWEVNRALRQAGNAPIQSSGNQMCLLSMCVCRQRLIDCGLRAVVIGPIHDSIMVDSPTSEVGVVCEVLKESMEAHNGAPYWCDKKVDITTNITIGPNLLEQH